MLDKSHCYIVITPTHAGHNSDEKFQLTRPRDLSKVNMFAYLIVETESYLC